MTFWGIGWTSECLRDLLNSSAPIGPVLIPRSQPSSQCRPWYVIGPDDSVAYADINVDYRSEPELFAVLLVLQRLQNATP